MLRRFAAVAVLTAVAAAPLAGLPTVNAQAPNLGGSDAGISQTLNTPVLGAAEGGSGGLQSTPSSASPVLNGGPTPADVMMPRSDVPAANNPMLQALPDPTPANPSPVTLVTNSSNGSTPAAPTNPGGTPVTPTLPRPVVAPDDEPATSNETPTARDLGAWAPGVTEPVTEPVPERSVARPPPVAPAPVVAVSQPAAPVAIAPVEVAPDPAPAAVADPAPAVDPAPDPVEAPVQPSTTIPVPAAPNLGGVALVTPGTAAPSSVSNVTAATGVSESETAEPAPADPVESSTTDSAPPATPSLPRISNPAPSPAFSIPALASLDMPGGLNLSLFVVLFGALGSAALGLHLLLRRMEATL